MVDGVYVVSVQQRTEKENMVQHAVSGTWRQAAPGVAQGLLVRQKYLTNLNQKSEFASVISALCDGAEIFSDVVPRSLEPQPAAQRRGTAKDRRWHRIHHVTKQHCSPPLHLEGRALEYGYGRTTQMNKEISAPPMCFQKSLRNLNQQKKTAGKNNYKVRDTQDGRTAAVQNISKLIRLLQVAKRTRIVCFP